jgi:Cellulase (glycosyl hydrolase family 5)
MQRTLEVRRVTSTRLDTDVDTRPRRDRNSAWDLARSVLFPAGTGCCRRWVRLCARRLVRCSDDEAGHQPRERARRRSGGGCGRRDREGDLDVIAAAGFDTLRLPVRWTAHSATRPPFTIDECFARLVDAAIFAALDRGLEVIVDMHHAATSRRTRTRRSNASARYGRRSPSAVRSCRISRPSSSSTSPGPRPRRRTGTASARRSRRGA